MRQCHTRDGLTSSEAAQGKSQGKSFILFRLQLHAFVPNALCFHADCIFGFVYRVRAQTVLLSRKIVMCSRIIFWTMHCSTVFLL